MPKQLKQAAERKKHSQSSPGGLINSDVVSTEMFEEIDMSWIESSNGNVSMKIESEGRRWRVQECRAEVNWINSVYW